MSVTISVEVMPSLRAVKVNVAGFSGTPPTIYRQTPTQVTPVEVNLAYLALTSESVIGVDYEAPMDVPLVYSASGAEVLGWTDVWHDDWDTASSDSQYADPVTVPSYGKDWYTALGQPSLSSEVLVNSFPEMQRPLAVSLAQPLNSKNPLPVVFARRGIRGDLTLITLTADAAAAMRGRLEASPLFLFKTPVDRGIPGGLVYLLAGDYSETRATRAAQDPTRYWVISVIEVDRPPLEVPPPAENTWQNWADESLANSSWHAWTGKSWLDVLTEELAGAGS